jgi:hypothetical protein
LTAIGGLAVGFDHREMDLVERDTVRLRGSPDAEQETGDLRASEERPPRR